MCISNERYNYVTQASLVLQLVKAVETGSERREVLLDFAATVFQTDPEPVASDAQSKIKPPQGLDLSLWVNPLAPETPPTTRRSSSLKSLVQIDSELVSLTRDKAESNTVPKVQYHVKRDAPIESAMEKPFDLIEESPNRDV